MRIALLLLFATCLAPSGAAAESLTIENGHLSVHYDSGQGKFAVAEKPGDRVLISEGRLLSGPSTEARACKVQDPTFGRGWQIFIRYADGSTSALELYPKLPFLVIRTELRNAGGEELDVRRVVPARFDVDLQQPPSSLRSLGTAGLTAVDQNPGSYLFLTVAEPATRRGVVAGWLTQNRASGVLFSTVEQGRVRLRAELEYGHLRIATGAAAKLETLLVGGFEDARIGQELYADAVARQYQIQLHPQLAGYCTWYSDRHGGAGDEKSIVELARVAAKELKPFGFEFIQIDDKWQDGQERNGPARRFYRVKPDGPYRHGIQPVADELRQLGFVTGLWFLPFASDNQDPEFRERQHWFMKKRDGTPYETPWGNTSLDLTQPEVQAYLSDLVKTIRSWGVTYFKMDGLWTGTATKQIYVNDGYREDDMGDNAPFSDPRKTNVEVMRDGLKLLRRAAGPDVFFSGCNLSQNMRSLAGSIGLVDSMRIGPDNGQAWRDYRKEISGNGSGSLITGPVRGTRLYFMHGRLWWNDPDPCYVRASIPLAHAQLITSWVGLSGQFLLDSDWIPGLPPERLDLLKRSMPAHRATARPVDYFDSSMPSLWTVTDKRGSLRRDVLGIFNWESHPQTFTCTATKAGLDPRQRYFGFDFWSNAPVPAFRGDFAFEVPGTSCRVVAVRGDEGHPVLVSTSRHVTQGIVDVSEELWHERTKTLAGVSQVVGNDPYQLRIAGLLDRGRNWRAASLAVSPADQAAGVTISSVPASLSEPGWLRVNIQSPVSRAVRWSVQFTSGALE